MIAIYNMSEFGFGRRQMRAARRGLELCRRGLGLSLRESGVN